MLHTLENYRGLVREASSCLDLKVYLAGGAIRDLVLDRTDKIQDLDLWIYTEDLEKTRREAQESGAFGRLVRQIGNASASLGRNGEIIAIDYFEDEDSGQEYNLIYLKNEVSLDALLENFDFGVNQAGIGPDDGAVVATNAFDRAVNEQLLEVTRKDSPDRAEKRLEKMRSKFPEWRVEDRLPTPPTKKPNRSLDLGYD